MKGLLPHCILFMCFSKVVKNFSVHPDTGLSIEKRIRKYGYVLEIHEVITDDGYILTMHRIPHGSRFTEYNKIPVLLVHGILASADIFIVGGIMNSSLAYILADNGYDVWLGNVRGNMHSRKHKSLNNQRMAYWKFSIHEIGVYDIPAMIDYILEKTQRTNLAYIGHSQGGSAFYIMNSFRPEYNSKIALGVLLAPAGFLKHFRYFDPLIPFFANQYRLVQRILVSIHLMELPPFVNLIRGTIVRFCSSGQDNFSLCKRFTSIITNIKEEQIVHDMVSGVLYAFPNSVSTYQIMHLAQAVESGLFRQFDYGSKLNMRKYNSKTPPNYNLTNVRAPIALFYGRNDQLSPYQDIIHMKEMLPNLVLNHVVADDSFGHYNFILDKDVTKLVYVHILEILKEYVM